MFLLKFTLNNIRSGYLLEEKEITSNKNEYINTIVHKQIALNQLDSLLTYHIENNNLKKANLL